MRLDEQWSGHPTYELMDLPCSLGAPRHCYIGDNVYWVKPMTLLGMATVMQWLDDVLPGRAERRMPPKIGDEASQKALQSFPGLCMLASLALSPHGFSYAQAAAIVPHSPDDDDDEQKWTQFLRLHEVYMARRRTMRKGEGGEDWSETWLEKGHAQFASEYGLEALGNLTLDQYEWLCSGGEIDEFGQFDLAAIQAKWRAEELPKILAAVDNGTMEIVPNG